MSPPLPRARIPQDELITLAERAKLLKVAEKTAQSAAVPGSDVRGQWRFRRSGIDAWVADQVARTTDNSQARQGSRGARK